MRYGRDFGRDLAPAFAPDPAPDFVERICSPDIDIACCEVQYTPLFIRIGTEACSGQQWIGRGGVEVVKRRHRLRRDGGDADLSDGGIYRVFAVNRALGLVIGIVGSLVNLSCLALDMMIWGSDEMK